MRNVARGDGRIAAHACGTMVIPIEDPQDIRAADRTRHTPHDGYDPVRWMAVLGRRSAIGLFPILGLLVGEDHSLPKIGLRRSGALVAYLDNLPRIYAGVWVGTLA